MKSNTEENTSREYSGSQLQDPLVTCEDIIKIYKQGKLEVVALRGLTIDLYPGEITLILGPSGCGKTTLLNLLGGLDIATSGKILFKGRDITKLSEKELEKYRRNHVGFVFQFLNLIPDLTAIENIRLPIQLSGKKTDEELIKKVLNLVGLWKRKDHRPDELSGGEQQRIAVAAALVNNSDLILCDEPTGELDSEAKSQVMDLLQELIRTYPEKAIVIVTHDSEIIPIANKVYYLKDGRVSYILDADELEKHKARLETSPEKGRPQILGSHDKALLFRELKDIKHYIEGKLSTLAEEEKKDDL